MMKKNKEVGLLHGNLLDFPYGINVIAHSCNTLNVMGAGIAEQIANRYPEAKEADDVADKAGQNDLGEFSVADIEIENTSMKDLLSRLDVQGFVLDIDQSLDQPPSIANFPIILEDSTTLNVVIKKDQSINDLYYQLSSSIISVSSVRNESNRLKEMFIEMVKKT